MQVHGNDAKNDVTKDNKGVVSENRDYERAKGDDDAPTTTTF